MAGLAIGTELGGGMRRIVGLGVIILVTSYAGCRGGIVVTVMTEVTVRNRCMCAGQCPVIVVGGE